MRTAQEREADFRRDLEAMLEKHGAEMDIDIDYTNYTFGSSPRPMINVTMLHVWDHEADKMIADFAHFEL